MAQRLAMQATDTGKLKPMAHALLPLLSDEDLRTRKNAWGTQWSILGSTVRDHYEADRAKLIEALQLSADALDLMRRHKDDLGNSNPGYMRNLSLQDYALMNEAFMALHAALARLKELGIPPTQP